MKKIIMSLSAVCLLSSGAFATTTDLINKQGGGPNGYNEIKQHNDGPGDNGNRTLDCRNPGYEKCVFTSVSSLIITSTHTFDMNTDIMPAVDKQVASGHLSGTMTMDPQCTVSWTATNLYNMTISIVAN